MLICFDIRDDAEVYANGVKVNGETAYRPRYGAPGFEVWEGYRYYEVKVDKYEDVVVDYCDDTVETIGDVSFVEDEWSDGWYEPDLWYVWNKEEWEEENRK